MINLDVMVVDDSVLACRKLEAMLATLGHRVIGTAGSGSEAVEVYRRCNPSLVTMDITMPDMDGIQATRGIIKEFPEARIIMVTSHGQEGMVRDALKAGAGGYILKPVNVDRLAEVIKKVIR